MTNPDIAKQNKTNRARGKAWEREVERGGREAGIDTDRTRDTGTHDQGDAVMRVNGNYYVLELKNVAKITPSFVDESVVEAANFAKLRSLPASKVHPVVFAKRRGKNFLDGLAIMSIAEYIRLIKAVDQ